MITLPEKTIMFSAFELAKEAHQRIQMVCYMFVCSLELMSLRCFMFVKCCYRHKV